MVFTFSNHPTSITNPSHCPQKINSQSEKIKLIKELHIDILMNIPFTQQLSTIAPEKFIKLLCDNINPEVIVVGPNFSFGYKGRGSPKTLVAFEKLYRFKTEISEFVLINKTIVSSTLIRKLIAEGQYMQVERFWGRAFHPEVKFAVY
ncbi:hypothetical protein [Sporomusa acidovorans]|nr:hypothetical protein [Sporomusa acidovorans]